jgi:propanol-preferring alcohol dehydrogenase
MVQNMRAMTLKQPHSPLFLEEIPIPRPGANQLLLKVKACGICRTDLHILDGELKKPKLPLILGHQVVGVVEEIGKNVKGYQKGDRVGVPWLGYTCGICAYCREGHENLCDHAQYTGYDLNGGFAEYCVCNADYAFHLPAGISDEQIAPLLCAGLIGYRAYRMAHPEKSLGIYGFGSAAHILTQIAKQEGKDVYAFTRDGDVQSQSFAKELGAVWAGGASDSPPELLDAAIIFAPVGSLVPRSLQVLRKGGRCICGGIHMNDIPSFPYEYLWGERRIESVSNLTRQDGIDFLTLISRIPIHTHVTTYPLEKANEALQALRDGAFNGSVVLYPYDTQEAS